MRVSLVKQYDEAKEGLSWDPHLLALQFLYNDADLDKSDLATFKHHTCSELLTRYHALLTRIAAMK